MSSSLAESIPLWTTLGGATTILVTPALDYVGALELGGLDTRFAGEDSLAGIGESLRSFAGGLEDRCTLHFLFRVYEDGDEDIADYVRETDAVSLPALQEYVASRTAWLRKQRCRRSRLFLFFNLGGTARSALQRGHLGFKLVFKPLKAYAIEEHLKQIESVSALKGRIGARLQQIGVPSRDMSPQEVHQLHYELLNPASARAQRPSPSPRVQDQLWSEAFVCTQGPHLEELTEAEQLCFEDVEDGKGHFRQGPVFRAVNTLKVLPEGGTTYFSAEALQNLATRDASGAHVPFGYTLAVTLDVQPQAVARWKLNNQHKLVGALRSALPFLRDSSASTAVDEAAKLSSIASLFTELSEMSSKLVSLSVSILLDAESPGELAQRLEATRSAFAEAGNSQLLAEDYSQLPAFLSMMPGAGPYQLRKKGCTSRNAADFVPVFMPWRGCRRAASVHLTPTGETFRFSLFDKSLHPASHGIVVADTGSGKSFNVGFMLLDALASGVDGILVDNGNSWKRLTQAMGGVHIPVDLNTSISPFMAYRHMLNERGDALDLEHVNQVVRFIEVCVTDVDLLAFNNLQKDLLATAVRRTYENQFRGLSERPLISHFRDELARLGAAPDTHPDDRRISEDIVRRLRMYCEGVYAAFLNSPSKLDFDARLLTFEMAAVSKDPLTKKIAMTAVMEAVTSRAAARRRRTLVAVDEAHEYLGNDKASEDFLAGCYAKMRKFDVAMWTISQKFQTFASCRVAPVIIENAPIRVFLLHGKGGHDVIARHFRFTPRATRAFSNLERRDGHFSDFLLMYGARMGVVRLAPHPFAYWLLTTDTDDVRALDQARERNPKWSDVDLYRELSRRLPFGAVGARVRGA